MFCFCTLPLILCFCSHYCIGSILNTLSIPLERSIEYPTANQKGNDQREFIFHFQYFSQRAKKNNLAFEPRVSHLSTSQPFNLSTTHPNSKSPIPNSPSTPSSTPTPAYYRRFRNSRSRLCHRPSALASLHNNRCFDYLE